MYILKDGRESLSYADHVARFRRIRKILTTFGSQVVFFRSACKANGTKFFQLTTYKETETKIRTLRFKSVTYKDNQSTV